MVLAGVAVDAVGIVGVLVVSVVIIGQQQLLQAKIFGHSILFEENEGQRPT